jgi:trimeric autotransporter adhesin
MRSRSMYSLRYYLIVLNFAISSVVVSGTNYITNYAGDGVLGTSGYSGDNGPATSAYLNNPRQMALDKCENLYIADKGNHAIRFVNQLTGIITTFAGVLGTSGATGDGSAVTSTTVKLNGPNGVALDSSGNVYIADTGNNVVRVVSSTTGIISLYAGSYSLGYSGDGFAATLAQLNAPAGLIFDSANNLYFTDFGSQDIRLVTYSTKIISTIITGTTVATVLSGTSYSCSGLLQLYYPALDANQNLYIPMYCNSPLYGAVIKYPIGGTATVYAGDGAAGYPEDGYAANSEPISLMRSCTLDSHGNLYIAGTGDNAVLLVTASDGKIYTYAGDESHYGAGNVGTSGNTGDGGAATSALLNGPNFVTVDSTGNVLVAGMGWFCFTSIT